MSRLTPVGWGFAILLIPVFVCGRILGMGELYVMGGILFFYLLLALILVILQNRRLNLVLGVFPEKIKPGENASIEVVLETRKSIIPMTLEISHVLDKDISSSIWRKEKIVDAYSSRPATRGEYQFGPAEIRITDPFGLANIKRKTRSGAGLLVLPESEVVSAPTRKTMVPDYKSSSFTSGEDFHSLREYIAGDSLKQINWKATAKHGNLMVRVDETDRLQESSFSVFLDNRFQAADKKTFELMVSATASLVESCVLNGQKARLLTADGKDFFNIEAWDFLATISQQTCEFPFETHIPEETVFIFGENTPGEPENMRSANFFSFSAETSIADFKIWWEGLHL